MKAWVWLAAMALGVAASLAAAGEGPYWGGPGYSYPGYPGYGQPSVELSIEQMRKLGLSAEQIQKISELRRDVEKDRVRLDAQLKAAQQAAAAANAEVSRLSQELYGLNSTRLAKVYEAVMSEPQLKAWKQQRYLDQAKQWLASYKQWLKLTDAQVEDISGLLVPVYEKYAKAEEQTASARDRLADLRKADKPDVAAIEKAEKDIAELSKTNVWQQRQTELMDKMKPGLLPDQIEKLDKMYRPQK
ncbi:MAG: hypothetical protein FJ291_30200 [Planctomycetes bacterium]|nr:hypothetical protein [Planctomycetota bacterium]